MDNVINIKRIPATAELDALSSKLCALLERKAANKMEFVEISVALCATLAQARDQFSADVGFGKWCDGEVAAGGKTLSHQDRAALIGLGRDLKLARTVFEETVRSSYRHIWEEVKNRFPVGNRFTHVGKPKVVRTTPPKPKKPSNNPPPTFSARHPFAKLPRGKELAEVFINKNGPSGVANFLKEPGCKEVWDMILQCYDAGFLRETRYYPNGLHDACTARLLFPELPRGYAAKFNMRNKADRKYIADVVIPVALANREALLKDMTTLEEFVKKADGERSPYAVEADGTMHVPTGVAKPISKPVVKSQTALTREQVDPEFTGTAMEWVDKYGHVQIMTAQEYATERFGAVVSEMRALAKRHKELPERRALDLNWLRGPLDERAVERLAEALEYLRPKFTEAEAALKVATEVIAKQKEPAQ